LKKFNIYLLSKDNGDVSAGKHPTPQHQQGQNTASLKSWQSLKLQKPLSTADDKARKCHSTGINAFWVNSLERSWRKQQSLSLFDEMTLQLRDGSNTIGSLTHNLASSGNDSCQAMINYNINVVNASRW